MITSALHLAEKGILPDGLIRLGIRRLLTRRLQTLHAAAGSDPEQYVRRLVAQLSERPVAEATDEANNQHYQVPTWFFQSILGPRLKYSSCYYPEANTGLAEAEEEMLKRTADHAALADGQRILELGCGWGSLTLWMAEHFPNAQITAVTNSETQAKHIMDQGFANVQVVKCDVNAFEPKGTFDRVVSVEMFEHVRNYHELFLRIENWLNASGKLFVHVFSHRDLPYLFEPDGSGDWMAREFFTGGTMPSQDFLPRFARGLHLEQDWRINGTHYARTLEDWLVQLDAHRDMLHNRFSLQSNPREAKVALQRWRMFLMACAELFAFRGGEEWGVSHYRFGKDDSK